VVYSLRNQLHKRDDFLNNNVVPVVIKMSEDESFDDNKILQSADVDELTAQIEAELNEYLNSTSSKPAPSSSSNDSHLKSTDPNIAASNSAFDESDFLSWLEETPDKNPAPSVVKPVQHLDTNTELLEDVLCEENLQKTLEEDLDNNDFLSSPSPESLSFSRIPAPVLPQSSPSSLATRSMDSLFDEIFGKDRPDSRTGSPMHAHLPTSLSPSNSLDSLYVPPSRKDFGEELDELLNKAIAEGGIGDVSSLRQLVSDAGYIPTEKRTIIWTLLLTGGRYCPDSAAAEVKRFYNT
jgi:hypothetical protein